jgi:valyl-tRNA synthetase
MDIPLAEGRMQGYRQFINKIWNASRFLLMNLGEMPSRPPVPPLDDLGPIHRWILSGVSRLTTEVSDALTSYRFDVAADRLYHFFWHEFADWYIEFVKLDLQKTGPERERAAGVLIEVHDRLMRLMHPFIPFITEEIWQKLPRRADDGQTLTLSAFPRAVPEWAAPDAERDVAYLQEIVTTIRTVRAERGVPPARKIAAVIDEADGTARRMIEANAPYLRQLAGLESLELRAETSGGADTVKRVLAHAHVYVLLAGAVDREAEIDKLRKELANLVREADSLARKLATPGFVDRAPASLVEDTRARVAHLADRQVRLTDMLKELGA